MTDETVALLSSPTNYAVVRLPSRRYPGVVVQGDTLHTLISRLEELRTELTDVNEDTLILLEDVIEELGAARGHYESVCKDHGINLPYRRDTEES